MADPRNFLLNTDYPMDKVIFLWEGYYDFSLPKVCDHGLSFTPLVKIVWSTTSTFDTTYGVGDGPVTSITSTPFSPQLFSAYADSSSIYAIFGYPGAVAGAYIRIYAFMPSNINVDTPPTASSADSFVVNTDYNYSKLLMEGVTATSSVSSSSEVVVHGLGYYPQVEVWYVTSGNTFAASQVNLFDGAPSTETFEITTSSLTMRRSPFLAGGEYFYYRIYADEL